jgi:hypothetical protein
MEDMLRLDIRCSDCANEMSMNQKLKKVGLFQAQAQECTRICTSAGCTRDTAFLRSTVCAYHFIIAEAIARNTRLRAVSKSIGKNTPAALPQGPRPKKRWSAVKHAMALPKDLAANNVHEFCFIDTEFCNTDWQHIILQEITVLDVHGRILINAVIENAGSRNISNERMASNQSRKPFRLRKIFRAAGQEVLSVTSLAQRMNELGLNAKTTFIQWGRYAVDSTILAYTFSQTGLGHIIDPKASLLPLYEWRRLLPNCPTFALEVFFPLLFPRSPLRGKNHRSLEDTEMLFHLTDLLCVLMDPPAQQDFTRFEDIGFCNPQPGQDSVHAATNVPEAENSDNAQSESGNTPKNSLKPQVRPKSNQKTSKRVRSKPSKASQKGIANLFRPAKEQKTSKRARSKPDKGPKKTSSKTSLQPTSNQKAPDSTRSETSKVSQKGVKNLFRPTRNQKCWIIDSWDNKEEAAEALKRF